MAERESRRVADDLMDEPHISGRRISVRQIYALVEERGVDPETVADRYDLDVADVYHALAYYHDHPREMSDVETDREEAMETFRESIDRPDGVEPRASDSFFMYWIASGYSASRLVGVERFVVVMSIKPGFRADGQAFVNSVSE